jgi:hypothetical protein
MANNKRSRNFEFKCSKRQTEEAWEEYEQELLVDEAKYDYERNK